MTLPSFFVPESLFPWKVLYVNYHMLLNSLVLLPISLTTQKTDKYYYHASSKKGVLMICSII